MENTIRRLTTLCVLAVLIAFACVLAAPALSQVAGMDGSSTQAFAAAKKAKPVLSKKSMALVYGKKATLKVTKNAGKSVKWSTSNKKVVKIVKKTKTKATIKALKAGKATITAKVAGKTLKCKVTVKGKLSKKTVTFNSLETVTIKLLGAKAKKWEHSSANFIDIKGNSTSCTIMPGSLGAAGDDLVVCTDTKGNTYSCDVSIVMPPIVCKLSGTEKKHLIGDSYFYYKRYIIGNETNKTITLNGDSAILYYPFGLSAETYAILPGMSSTSSYFDDAPLTIPAHDAATFWGNEGLSSTDIYSSGESGMTMLVGGKKYSTLFKNSGELKYFIPE